MTTLHPNTRELTWPGGRAAFTGQQAAVLEALARARGRVVERAWLIEQVIGEGHSRSLLDVVVCAIRRRLTEAGAPVGIDTVWGSGIVLRPEVEIEDARVVTLAPRDRRVLRRLLGTHPDAGLVAEAWRVLGEV